MKNNKIVAKEINDICMYANANRENQKGKAGLKPEIGVIKKKLFVLI